MDRVIANRYELAGVIGTGGMSDVYAATDTLLGREVAVKVLRLDLARDATFRERFRREAQNAGRLNHAAIVAVYDTGETVIDGVDVPYIVMERVHGPTLREVLDADGAMGVAEATGLLLPVCEALSVSHEAGIVHRDIKPANIMITPAGAVKVMDFGIARALGDTTSAMTQTAAVIGTAQYLSPEQARGKTVDARSDVYALGCLLYEMLTGEPPFRGETPFAVAYQHVQEDPEPPSSRMSGLGPAEAVNVDAVVLTAMAKHPADRYQTAGELAADLSLLSRGAVTHAARSHVTTRGAADDAGSGAGVTGVAGAGVAGAGAALAADGAREDEGILPPEGARGGGARRARGSHRRERSRRPRILVAVLALATVLLGGFFIWDLVGHDGVNPSQNAITLPDVAGMERQAAITRLERLGLDVTVGEEPSPTVPRDRVIRSNPAAGSALQPGTAVTVLVSSGREVTEVPDLTGMGLDEAGAALERAGLELDTEARRDPSDTVPEGSISAQEPTPGARVAKGDKVAVTVSTGPQLIDVPDLRGSDAAQAESALRSLGLNPVVREVESTRPRGEVISVAQAGQAVPRGSDVQLEVSDGSGMVMPDLTGKTRAQALAALRAAGWSGSDRDLVTGEPVRTVLITENDLVAETSPPAGTRISDSAPITVRYYSFSLSAVVP